MKNILLTSFIFLSFFTTQAQVTEDWESPDDYYGKQAKMIAVDGVNSVFTVSHIFNGDIYLTKRDVNGNILWSTGYDNVTPSQWEVAQWVAVDPFGDAIVTGYTNTGFGTEWYPVQMVTMKFSGIDGSLLWRVTENTGSAHRGRVCLIDATGNIYVGGEINAWMASHNEVGNQVLIKYDSDGNLLWKQSTDNVGNLIPGPMHAMKFDNFGNIILTGVAPFAYDVHTVKINPAGIPQWHIFYESTGAADIAIAPDNSIYILSSYGYGLPIPSQDVVVRKVTSGGVLIWEQNYNFGAEESGKKIVCDNSGNAIITGYSSPGGYTDWITFKIDVDGNLLWNQYYNQHTGNDEWPWQMVIDESDNVYITGQGGPWPGFFWVSLTQMVTVKYNPEGVEEWVALNDYTNYASVICLGTENDLFVGGSGYAVTVHYTQTVPTTCEVPSGLFTNNITTTKARLNWTLEPDAIQYEVWYKKTTAVNWKKKFVPGINNKINLKNLTCNTNYVWKIRTVCDIVSGFSADQFFTTSPCREEDVVLEDNISIYPNPAFDKVHIYAGDLNVTGIKISDMTGKILLSSTYEINEEIISLNLNDLPSGSYIISIQSTNTVINKQIVIIK